MSCYFSILNPKFAYKANLNDYEAENIPVRGIGRA